MSARYITTTLPYVNADPHIGFALEIIQADVLARMWRHGGDEVFFSTGTDEHGQKIYDAAKGIGQDVQDYVNHYVGEVKKLKKALNLSNDVFIRTTDPVHIKAAREMWRLCDMKGDIYKKSYSGLYCIGCELFKAEKELIDGRCSTHPNFVLEEVSEENYFFRFSRYQEQLLSYLERTDVVIPDWRKKEAIAFVKGGLEDFSISREKKRLTWGIPVPNDDKQVMYVWFDALTDYISTLGWPKDAGGNFKKYWENGTTLQMAGKDQVRFQSLMWQAMLMSAEIKNTDRIFYHGFINSGGQKMSKSLGNVISPFELVEKYGTDATRYMLLRHVSPTEDSDLTLSVIHEHYTAHLTNGLGNLVARVMRLAEEHLQNPIAITINDEKISDKFFKKIEEFKFNEAMDFIFAKISAADAYMNTNEPYKKIKTEAEVARNDIGHLVRELASIATHLAPTMPHTSEIIMSSIRSNKKPDNLFPRL
jgi:methionyl-tRNA synthetase